MDGFKTEAKESFKLAWPIILAMLLHFMTSCTSVIFCGHLGKEAMAAVTLASMVINIFGFATTMGLASACDTLFAQSYGSSNKTNMGVILQRGLVVLLLTCIPTFAIFLNTEHILVAAGQNKHIARNAGIYTKIFITGLPGMAISQVLRRFVYVQGIITAQIVAMVIANVINVGIHLLFVSVLHFGIIGAAISFSITNWAIGLLFGLYILLWKKYKGLWNGWSWDCLEDWGEFFGLAVPGMLMLLVEWTSAEIITIISGLLGTIELDAYTITYNTVMFVSMFPIGMSFGITIRVGTHLGANKPELARCTSRVTMAFALFLGLLMSVLTFSLRTVIPHIFTTDGSVIYLAESIMYLMSLYLLFSGVQQVLDGVVRGTGNQLFGAIVNLSAYLVICLPIAIPVMLKTKFGVQGGYVGLASGSLYQGVMFIFGILRMDWDKQAQLAQERSKVTKESDKDNHITHGTPDSDSNLTTIPEVNPDMETQPNNTRTRHDSNPDDPCIKHSETKNGHEVKETETGKEHNRSKKKHKSIRNESKTANHHGHFTDKYTILSDTEDDNKTTYGATVRYQRTIDEVNTSGEHFIKDKDQLLKSGFADDSVAGELKPKCSRHGLVCKRFALVITFAAILGIGIGVDQYLMTKRNIAY